LLEELNRQGHEVLGIDLKDGNDILDWKYSNVSEKWEKFRPEYIFHLAAIPRVAYSVEHPVEVVTNNVLSSLHVLELARRVGARRVIYSSSSSVRGNGDGPENPYGASKYMPESMCGVWPKLYGIDTVCLRYFNVYSYDQKAEGPYATAVANWMQFLREGKRPFITGDGEQRRDMANKLDVISANIFAMEYGGQFRGKPFDVGTGTNISLNEMKNLVLNRFPDVAFDHVESRKGDVLVTKADVTPLRRCGWTPRIPIHSGVDECFRKLKEELT
jgi:UDP-glucose 4-epimerase